MRKLDKPADIFTAIAQSAREKEVSGGVKDAKDDVMEEEGEESGEVIAKVSFSYRYFSLIFTLSPR